MNRKEPSPGIRVVRNRRPGHAASWTRLLGLASLIIVAVRASAADENSNTLFHAAERFHARMSAEYKGNADIMVSRGLVADRRTRRIDLLAVSTGVAKNSPVEFLLVSPESGHDYEALAIAAVDPSTVHEALTFIGLEPGRSVNSSELEFWPKGERVTISFACRETNYWEGRIAAENLVRDSVSGNSMPSSGFVFVGSHWFTPQNSTNRQCLADVTEPHSIASLYNEMGTVLDLPGQATQGAVYGTRLANPEYVLPANTLLDIRIVPERVPGAPRVREMILSISAVPHAQPGLAGVRGSLKEDNKSVFRDRAMSEVLRHFSNLVEKEFDPFVVFSFDGHITMEQAKAVSEVLSSLEGERGIRIEPPPQGQLYYKAFLPNEKHRNRGDRHAQPWELHLYSSSSTNRTLLTHIEEIWKDDSIYPELKPTNFHVGEASELRALIDKHGPGLPVILVFAEAKVTHAELMHMLAPVMSTHGTVHVFVD
jgi:hypothetical protein